MALKQIRLRMQIESKRNELKQLEEAANGLEERRTALKLREAELETAYGEVTGETEEADKQMLEEQTDVWEKDNEALEGEEKENEDKRNALESEIDQLKAELAELDKRTEQAMKPKQDGRSERKVETTMETRKFFGMNMQERDAFFARKDVQNFLTELRALGAQKRAVSGADLLIPTVVLGLIRENVNTYSKLYKHVYVRNVPGKARMIVMGTPPEAVWTEMCAKLNELEIRFNEVEVDGYKVGGYIAICNALLEDSDVALASEIISALGQAIGLALDKAILYGTGTKMPLGIVTRLAQKAAPENYGQNARPWVDLSATNMVSITSKTDAALFKAILAASGNAKGKYSNGTKFWAMNETTHMKLIENAMSINAAGAITAGVNGVMPVVNGVIEELSFIPDNVIIGGYGDLYLLAERAGTAMAQSEHVRFIEDQTVFKGTARYDGMPVIPEGFVAMDIGGGTINATAVAFAEDLANA